MRAIYYILLSLAAILAAHDSALSQTDVLSDDQQAQLQKALGRGQKIYLHDQAAWHTTDALQEIVPRNRWAEIRGWIVDVEERGFRVTYYGTDERGYYGIFSALWSQDNGVSEGVLITDKWPSFSANQLRRIEAIQVAREQSLTRCVEDRPFNVVAFPDEEQPDRDIVYLLSPTLETNSYPAGKHYQLTVEKGKIVSQRAFTNSCLVLRNNTDQKVAALFLTHLLDPVPTEIHAFLALSARQPIYVSIAELEKIWVMEIIGGEPRARLVEVSDKAKK